MERPQGNRVKGGLFAEMDLRARGPHKTRHCAPASLDAGEAIQGVFMMSSPWIAPLWGGGQPPPHKDLDCFVTSFLAMTECGYFWRQMNHSCGFSLPQASFTRLP